MPVGVVIHVLQLPGSLVNTSTRRRNCGQIGYDEVTVNLVFVLALCDVWGHTGSVPTSGPRSHTARSLDRGDRPDGERGHATDRRRKGSELGAVVRHVTEIGEVLDDR